MLDTYYFALVDSITTFSEVVSQLGVLAQAGGEAAQPAAEGGAAGGGPGPAGQPPTFFQGLLRSPLTLFAGVMFLFYMLVLLPERRRQRETANLRSSLKKNDRVVTTGGIFGVVVNVNSDSDEVTIRVDESNNTRLRVLRSAIGTVTPAATPNGKDSASGS